MDELQASIECHLDVIPEVDHRVELEHATTFNGVQIVVVQEIENDVFTQPGPTSPGSLTIK